MNLQAYFDRIGFNGTARIDVATLRELHRAHVHTVPFENLDVQLQRPVTLDVPAAYSKIVTRRRGGWCYELNGLLGWALGQIGFDVRRLSAGVMRETHGDGQMGGHLCLLVRLGQRYLVDVGFGSSLLEPIELTPGRRNDAPYSIELAPVDSSYWRFTERVHGEPFSFDFTTAPAAESLLAARSTWLQSDEASQFVQNLVVQRRDGENHLSLRGRVLTRTHASEVDKHLLNSADELVACLRDRFDLDVPEAASLWPAICARHEAVFNRSCSARDAMS